MPMGLYTNICIIDIVISIEIVHSKFDNLLQR